MDAENVWYCIVAYRGNTAKEIYKRFNNNRGAIIAALSGYQGKELYHGHVSGHSGNNTSQSADQNLDAAIEFLRNCAVPQATEGKKGANEALKRQNVQREEMLTAIIDKGIEDKISLDQIRERLFYVDPGWESVRRVLTHFDQKRIAKKQLNTNKLAKK